MAHAILLGFCSIMLLNIYSASAQNGASGLAPTSITSTGFTVQWNEADFSSSTGQFKVTVDGPEGNLCDVQRDCSSEGDPPLCTFRNNAEATCGFLITAQLVPCTNITVTVARGETDQSVAFNLAADIKDGPTDLQLTVDGNETTLRWENSLNSNGGDISCATRVKATLQVGAGSEWTDGAAMDVPLDASSSQDWTLDDCQQGDLKAKVIYLTKTGDFPTFKEFQDKDNKNFPGVGATSVSAKSSGECSLEASWEVGCSEVDHYTVTCGGEENLDVNNTTYTCSGLTAETQTVTVQAYLTGGDTIGGNMSTTQVVPPIAPDAPNVKNVVGNNETLGSLMVTWEKPTTPICNEVTGYKITALLDGISKVVKNTDDVSLSCVLDGLEANTNYTVSVMAKWSEGTGAAGIKTGKTGIQGDSDLSGGEIAGIVIGSIAGVALFAGGTVFLVKWKKKN